MTLVMGVLNVTPDSFSDGGLWFDPDAALAHGLDLITQGADIVDVGGESTRPGGEAVTESEELRRVLPVVSELSARIRVSIDTRKAAVAEAALAAGATIINDTSATLWPVAAAGGAGWIAMHMRGEPATMQRHTEYHDVVQEVRDALVARAEQASAAGVRDIWIDPGIGFAKTGTQNLSLLRHLHVLVSTGFRVAVGSSRKSFLGAVVSQVPGGRGSEGRSPVDDRLEGSVAAATWALTQGVNLVRVHDVAPTVYAAELVGRRRGPGEVGV